MDLPQTKELVFRDGKREVPEYLANWMGGLSLYAMTYDEAVAAANHAMEASVVDKAVDRLISDHFRVR